MPTSDWSWPVDHATQPIGRLAAIGGDFARGSSEKRDYDAIEKPVPFGFDVGDDESKAGAVVDQLRWLAGMGIQSVFGWVVGVDRIEPLEIRRREVIPAVADL